MSASPEPVPDTPPEVVNFPIPQMPDRKLVLRQPSIDSILRMRKQMPGQRKLKLETPKAPEEHEPRQPEALIDNRMDSVELAEEELREKQREFARVQADAMERLRAAKELEILLASRESLLDDRESMLAERESMVAAREDRSLNRKPREESGEGAPAPIQQLDGVTHPTLQEQVAFLREREAFIEESENVLFNKAQELQEWETRLQQMEAGMRVDGGPAS